MNNSNQINLIQLHKWDCPEMVPNEQLVFSSGLLHGANPVRLRRMSSPRWSPEVLLYGNSTVPTRAKTQLPPTDHTLLRCWHTPLTAQSPLQLINHFVPCALSSSKIIKTYHIYIIFTYCIRTASRPSPVHGMKPSGMLQPFLHNAQAGIPTPSGPERLCISFCSAFPTAQRRLALTCAHKL